MSMRFDIPSRLDAEIYEYLYDHSDPEEAADFLKNYVDDILCEVQDAIAEEEVEMDAMDAEEEEE